MNTLSRNFLAAFRRSKTAFVLNIVGLSVAFAAFMVIMMQVTYEWTFDRSYPNADRIVRAEYIVEGSNSLESCILARGMLDAALASSPHVQAGTLLNPFIGDVYVTVGEEDDRRGFKEPVVTCYSGMATVFGMEFTEGGGDCLAAPSQAIIPQSMANRLFGKEPAVGKAIHLEAGAWSVGSNDLTVGGVYKDLPDNSQITNAIYTLIDDTQKDQWGGMNFLCYMRIDDTPPTEVQAEVNRAVSFRDISAFAKDATQSIRLVPIVDTYYHSRALELFGGSVLKTGSETSTRILFLIGLLVIIIAAINFTNFSVAQAPMRMRSLNTQKILGSTTASLRRHLTVEAMLTAFAAWLLSIGIVWLLVDNNLLPFVDAGMNALHEAPLMLTVGGIALLTGLLAGLYPAYYVTSFQPALALKGSFAFSPAGRRLRTGLIGFQYIISIGLIIAAIFVQLQTSYMRNFNPGFDKDQIAVVELNASIVNKSSDAYVNGLKSHPGIVSVGFADHKFGSSDGYTVNSIKYKDELISTFTLPVSYNFFDVMGIPIVEGRDFTPADEKRKYGSIAIINKPLHDKMQIEAGGKLEDGTEVVGTVGDVKVTSLRKGSDNILFITYPQALPISYIRLKAGTNIPDAVRHIRETVASIDPTYPVDVEFYDDIFNRLYAREDNMVASITLLSLLAIILNIAGVFGLVLFETQYRRKEISLRKVHGATVGDILRLFNAKYVRIVTACFVLASPVAWYGVQKWLEGFSYKEPMHWWVFVLAFAVVAFITLTTVTLQNWRAANANPIDSIKTE